jgi:hypothetical protein
LFLRVRRRKSLRSATGQVFQKFMKETNYEGERSHGRVEV